MFPTLLNNDNQLINWIKTEIKLQSERNWNKIELQRNDLGEDQKFSNRMTIIVPDGKSENRPVLFETCQQPWLSPKSVTNIV